MPNPIRQVESGASGENFLRGPLTYTELSYGKFETDKPCTLSMRLVAVVLDQLLDKDPSRIIASSDDVMVHMDAKKYPRKLTPLVGEAKC